MSVGFVLTFVWTIGKRVVIEGSHVKAGAGFADGRKVRILLSEQREVQSQRVTVLHLSRPLCGGIAVPEDPNELDVATFRRYTAILRSFPENELVFVQLDETVSQVQKICQQRQFFDRYERTLPSILKEEWEAAVDELISAGSLDEDEEQDGRRQSHSGGMDHLLPIQQVVECYLMEELHEFVFPHVIESCREEDEKLQRVLHQMRHYTPEDFGIRKEFQVRCCWLWQGSVQLGLILAVLFCVAVLCSGRSRCLTQGAREGHTTGDAARVQVVHRPYQRRDHEEPQAAAA